MKKRGMILLVCLLLAGVLTGCGNRNKNNVTTTPTDITPQVTDNTMHDNNGIVNDTDGIIDDKDTNNPNDRTDQPVTDQVITDVERGADRVEDTVENGLNREYDRNTITNFRKTRRHRMVSVRFSVQAAGILKTGLFSLKIRKNGNRGYIT